MSSKMERIAREVTAQIVGASDVPPGLLRVFTRLSDLVQEAYCAGREDERNAKKEDTTHGGMV